MRTRPSPRATGYQTGPSPAGWIGVVAGTEGLVVLILAPSEAALEERLARDYPLLPQERNGLCAAALGQLQDYFAGVRHGFDLPLDLQGLTPFARDVLTALLLVPAGATIGYGELAALAGHPGAARAVGRVMANNPWPLVIPCHRVVGSDGALTGYSAAGGTTTKAWLLEFERRFRRK